MDVLNRLTLEAGAFFAMDRGHVDCARLHALHQAMAFLVTRTKSPMDARQVYPATTDRTMGVICDRRVMLGGHHSARKYSEHLRRIQFRNPESGKTLVFRTNNAALPALDHLRRSLLELNHSARGAIFGGKVNDGWG